MAKAPRPTRRPRPVAANEGAPATEAPSPAAAFPVVGIGASAGGLEALEEFFAAVPPDAGMAFVVVTHQHPGHKSLLADLLGKVTALPVVEATDGVRVRPNHVYVGLPGGHLAISAGVLRRIDGTMAESPRLPIDFFLRSLADDLQHRAIGVVLSGTGTDGTLGVRAIKGVSGLVLVQRPQSAKYAGMPSSAIATGLADFVLPPGDMPGQLVAFAKSPYLAAPLPDLAAEVPGEPLAVVFALLRSRTGHDFSGYKPSTIRRRITGRTAVHQLADPSAYVRYAQEHPEEISALFRELLITVTSFFRDAEAFEHLATAVLPDLLASLPDHHTIRAWLPGCATGEEVFTLAIVLHECMEATGRHFDVQLFGTDLDSEAIDVARSAHYPDGIEADVSARRLERYFTRDDTGYRVRKEIREMTIFAVQNLIKDPPFTRLDLLSCRNLLIYLGTDLQRRLIPVFHYALRPGGLLLLGPSETVDGFTDLFEAVDKKWRLFRRREAPSPPRALAIPAHAAAPGAEVISPAVARRSREVNLAAVVDRMLLTRFVPASVVINERGEVVYIHGRTGEYLEPATGRPRLNILDMAREGLQLELASALREAASIRREVTRTGVRVRTNGDVRLVDLTVTPIQEPDAMRGLLVVTFRPSAAPPPSRRKGPGRGPREPRRIEALERELQATKDSLQTTIEALESSNEDLRSANEELQSTNEEMQSANEELETSKEEMQSLNEELSMVNAELHSKVDQLSRSNDDMENLINSIEIATVFLDKRLHIVRYTSQARQLVHLIPTDVGRPLADLASSLAYDQLVADCREVLRTLVFKQAEVRNQGGDWFLMRILPYRTAENVVDGVVITFVNINATKQAEAGLRRLAAVVKDSNDAMIVHGFDGAITAWNRGAERMYGWAEAEALCMNVRQIVPEPQRAEWEALQARLKAGGAVDSFAADRVTRDGRRLRVWITASLLTDDAGRPVAVATTERDLATLPGTHHRGGVTP